MARTYTLAQLRTRVRQRADQENSTFVADSEVNQYISSSYGILFGKLVDANPDMYMREATISGDGSTSDFAMPSDFYGTIAVEYTTGGAYYPLSRISPIDAYIYENSGTAQATVYHYVSTSSSDQADFKMRLIPTPANGDSYRHKYIYAPTVLDSDSETVDGVAGWEEWIVLDAAIKCLAKEESSTAILERQLERLDRQIEALKAQRTFGETTSISSRAEPAIDPSSWWFKP